MCGTDLRFANDWLAYVHSVDSNGLVAIARRRACYAPIRNSIEEREIAPQHPRREHGWWGQPDGRHIGSGVNVRDMGAPCGEGTGAVRWKQ